MPFKFHPLAPLERENDQLRTTICSLRRELENKQGAVGRLELALIQRSERIDELANTIATLRDQNRRLNEEAENYFRMLAAG
jgi:chromosome segregation ATPase